MKRANSIAAVQEGWQELAYPILWFDATGRLLFHNRAADCFVKTLPLSSPPPWQGWLTQAEFDTLSNVEYVGQEGLSHQAMIWKQRWENGLLLTVLPSESSTQTPPVASSLEERMSAIASLAATVVHDLGNLLTPILVNLEKVRQSIKEPLTLHTLGIVESCAQRGLNLTHRLLAISDTASLVKDQVSLALILHDLRNTMATLTPAGVTLRVDYPAYLPLIVGDIDQVHSAILNLVVNAFEATGQGEVSLTAGLVELDGAEEKELLLGPLAPGKWVRVTVQDQGAGIDPAEIRHIFDLHFSTKSSAKPRGLGLTSVFATMRRHGGNLRVHSAGTGQGATFELFFPVAQVSSESAPRQRAGQLVLLAEHDVIFQERLLLWLQQEGCIVFKVTNGVEAAECFEKFSEDIDLIFCDVHLPEMNGLELYHRARASRRDLPVVLMGLSCLPATTKCLSEDDLVYFWFKPFNQQFLREQLAALAEKGMG